jgi:hypothetical protein
MQPEKVEISGIQEFKLEDSEQNLNTFISPAKPSEEE